MTPAEELAGFLASRGHCAFDHSQFLHASRSYENAYRYDTKRPAYRAWFAQAVARCNYQPSTPALVRYLAQRQSPMASVERVLAEQDRQFR